MILGSPAVGTGLEQIQWRYVCFNVLGDFLVQSFGLSVNDKISKTFGKAAWCFLHMVLF